MRVVSIAAVLAASLAPAVAQIGPYINKVVDAASYSSGIAPGSLFVVKGYSLTSKELRISPLPLQERFNDLGVTLTPAAGGPTINAFVLYTYGSPSLDQIAAVLPSSAPAGAYAVAVVGRNGSVTATGKARVVLRKYRSLTNNQEGYGLAVVQNYVNAARLDRNMFVGGALGSIRKSPANPGQAVILWGLGLGAIDKPDNEAPGVLDLRATRDIRVAVGGVPAPVIYAGRAPEFPGVDQINFIVPANVPAGCNVPLEVILDGAASNPVTIAIAPAGKDACEHPFLSRDQLETLDQGGKFMAGEFTTVVYRDQATSAPGQPFVEIFAAQGYFDERHPAHPPLTWTQYPPALASPGAAMEVFLECCWTRMPVTATTAATSP